MSDWRDPFTDDEAAREREARRAERERRRLGEETRESLGERVRSGMAAETPKPAPTQVQPAAPPPPPPPPPRRPAPDAIHRRRMWALVGLGVLIVAIAVVGTIISRG